MKHIQDVVDKLSISFVCATNSLINWEEFYFLSLSKSN